jgi:signal transduction histidine kinase/DNA-binding response OmpR family regulator
MPSCSSPENGKGKILLDTLIIKVAIRYEQDVVLARQRAREIAEGVGFDQNGQTRISSAVSEIARNAYRYAGGGEAEFLQRCGEGEQSLVVLVSDRGPGIGNLQEIMDGQFRSTTGMGKGILGARRLMDDFHIESTHGKGTTVTLIKTLPAKAPLLSADSISCLKKHLLRIEPQDLHTEIVQQNQELIHALEELQTRKEELERMNMEIEDTNRGVMALYAELEEKAGRVRAESDARNQFFSSMSHELRTPINSILSLSRLLLDRVDGDLGKEQERQVAFIKTAAEVLSSLINDILDLSKIQAGKIAANLSDFSVQNVFSALRGMIKPLLVASSVALVIEETEGIPLMYSDEGKVSQILRNLASNAIKFTEAGEVRISARPSSDGNVVVFSVADSGIGIAEEDLEGIFEEYTQVDSSLQRKNKGTGLGLALCKKLAEFLGGRISVQSVPGVGSRFYVEIPIRYSESKGVPEEMKLGKGIDVAIKQVLVIEDNPAIHLVYETFLRGEGYQVVSARTLTQAATILASTKPFAIILDIILERETSWDFLQALKLDPKTADIPIIIVSVLDEAQRGVALGADDYCVKPIERDWLMKTLSGFSQKAATGTILVIDDEEVARYVLRSYLAGTKYTVIEASNGEEGIRLARKHKPDIIFLDLMMPGLSGFETLGRLKSDSATRDIPVVINSSQDLTEEERRQLAENAADIISKQSSSREESLAHIGRALAKITMRQPKGN